MADSIVRAQPLTEQVYQLLRQAILSGQFSAGERIVETKLAEMLHTSRSPVREAIRLLCAEKLLERRQDAVYVFKPSLDDLRQLFELRMAVESMSAELAAERATPADLEHLERILEVTREAESVQDNAKLVQCNTDFHQYIIRITGNQRFSEILEDVLLFIGYYSTSVLRHTAQRTRIYEPHSEIFASLRIGDGPASGQLMRNHVRRNFELIKDRYVLSIDECPEQEVN